LIVIKIRAIILSKAVTDAMMQILISIVYKSWENFKNRENCSDKK